MCALLTLTLTGAAVPAAQSGSVRHDRVDMDLTASALTAPESPTVIDNAYDAVRSAHRPVKADAVAAAAATCDGCTADASALHIVHVYAPRRAGVNNVATAWSQCADCRATALSVQVVVVHRQRRVQVNNRALSVNASCDQCLSAAAAFQLVLGGNPKDRMGRRDRMKLKRWVAQQAASLRGDSAAEGSPARTAGSAETALNTLAHLAGDAWQGVITHRDVAMR